MRRVIGLDLSLTAPGVAWTHTAAGDPIPGCRTYRPGDTVTGDERNWRIRQAVQNATLCRPELAIIEGASYGSKSTNRYILDQAELAGVVKLWLYSQRIPYLLVAPGTRAIYATGHGQSTKDEVTQMIRATYGAYFGGPAAIADHDSADAIALLALGLHVLGEPLVDGLPPQRARAVDTVRAHLPSPLLKELILR